MIDEAEELIDKVVDEIKDEIKKDLVIDTPNDLLELNFNQCTGKYGACVYDDMQDPAHDDCLVCHQPSERK